MTILAHTFDRMRITPSNDSLLYSSMYNGLYSFKTYPNYRFGTNQKAAGRIIPGYKNQMRAYISGSNVVVEPGACVVFGRLIEITESETIPIPSNASGSVPLCVRIDLTKVNTSSGTPGSDDYIAVNNQVTLGIVVGSKNEENLNEGGHLYDWKFAQLNNTGTGTPGIVQGPTTFVENSMTFLNGWHNPSNQAYTTGLNYSNGYVEFTGNLTSTNTVAANASVMIGKIPLELCPFFYHQLFTVYGDSYWALSVGRNQSDGCGDVSITPSRQLPGGSEIRLTGIGWIPLMAQDPFLKGGELA